MTRSRGSAWTVRPARGEQAPCCPASLAYRGSAWAGLGSGQSACGGQVGAAGSRRKYWGGPLWAAQGSLSPGQAPPGRPEALLTPSAWPAPGVQVSASVKYDKRITLPTDVEPPPRNDRRLWTVVCPPHLTSEKMPVTVIFRKLILQWSTGSVLCRDPSGNGPGFWAVSFTPGLLEKLAEVLPSQWESPGREPLRSQRLPVSEAHPAEPQRDTGS